MLGYVCGLWAMVFRWCPGECLGWVVGWVRGVGLCCRVRSSVRCECVCLVRCVLGIC